MTRNDVPVSVDQDRNVEAKHFNAARDLYYLPLAMMAWIARIELQLRNIPIDHGQLCSLFAAVRRVRFRTFDFQLDTPIM